MAFEIVVVGTSTGGLKALQTLLSGLPAEFSLPIVFVQHRRKDSESGLSEFLGERSRLPVIEPDDKEPLLGGHVYLAPRDYHLLIENRSFALSIVPPVRFARPSIDVLFESAADAFLARADWILPLPEIAPLLFSLSESGKPSELLEPEVAGTAIHYGS